MNRKLSTSYVRNTLHENMTLLAHKVRSLSPYPAAEENKIIFVWAKRIRK